MSGPLDESPDESLVKATLSGDDESFTELVRRHKRSILLIASRFARDGHELDDLGQDIFIKVFQNLAGFRGDAPFEHWLKRIAIHACYDMLRKRRREHLVPLEDLDFSAAGPVTEDGLLPLQAKEILDRAMPRLRADERLALTLMELEGYTVKEAAKLTGWSESKVKVQAFRGRQALKKILRMEDEGR